MLLKLVDRLVKEGNYAEALRILARATEEDPKNPYVKAYEARIRILMESNRAPSQALSDSGRAPALAAAAGTPQTGPSSLSADQRRVALLSRVAAILSKANEYLSSGDFQRALEEVGRARLLDAENPDIKGLEQRIRETRQDAERMEEAERARLARDQEEAHRAEMEALRREEELRRAKEEQARRDAHERKLGESLGRCRALLASGRLKEAQNELAFAIVLDPRNHAARQLEQEISRAHEQALRAEMERTRLEEEARARAARELHSKIQAAAQEALKAASGGAFGDALDIITKAYVLDPASSILQTAEAQIAAARDTSIQAEREEQLARKREEEQHQLEAHRRKADEERQALLRQGEAKEESRRRATRQENEHHLDRARTFFSHAQFEAALAEVALAFVIDPLSEATRSLEQEILQARDAAPGPAQAPPVPPPDPVETPAAIAVHLDAAREHASMSDFARAFDSIARAYAVDPLHPAVQDCEHLIQAAFVEYQGSLAQTAQPYRGHDGPPVPRATVPGLAHVTATPLPTFADLPAEEAAGPGDNGEGERAFSWYRNRPVMYGGGIGTLVVVAAMFLMSSPSGEKPVVQDEPAATPARTELVASAEPQSTPVTLSEPKILPVEEPQETPPRRESTQTRVEQREEPEPVKPEKIDTSQETPAETPPEPPVAPGRFEVQSRPLTQQRSESSVPTLTQTPKAPEIKRLEQPRIPDALLSGGYTGECAVLVEIDAGGRPVSARVSRSTSPAFNEYFIEAVMASEFVPGVSEDGKPTTQMSIQFKVGG
jgi:TonB family protein